MLHSPVRWGPATVVLASTAILVLGGCDTNEPAALIEDVTVTSTLDTIIPVGITTRLTAVATERDGSPVSASFDWSSSAPAVATVNGSGDVLGVGAGRTTITATPAAGGVVDVGAGVAGTIPIRVLDADIAGFWTILDDPLVDHLTNGLGPSKTAVEAALSDCSRGLGSGALVLVFGCLEAVQTATHETADGTDRALLATLSVMMDFARNKLHE